MEKEIMNNKGFTLIELMIVIAIIGVLSTMALPSFQDRVIRTQIKEALQLAAFVQDEIQQYYRTQMKLPESNTILGLPLPEKIVGNYVTKLNVSDGGRIDITLGNRINKHVENKIISLRPGIVEDEPKVPIAWVKGHASIPEGMMVKSENRTNIKIRHLPMSCRY